MLNRARLMKPNSYKFKCPLCGLHLSTSFASIGAQGECPKCKNAFLVPKPRSPLWALAIVYPTWLRPIYRGWMRFGLLASRVTTPIILGIVFYLAITPISFLLRLGAKDPMRRAFEPDATSYRVSSHKLDTDRLEKPF